VKKGLVTATWHHSTEPVTAAAAYDDNISSTHLTCLHRHCSDTTTNRHNQCLCRWL